MENSKQIDLKDTIHLYKSHKVYNNLSKDDYSLYLEKQNEYGGLAFAEVNRKSCSNCCSELPPQLYIDIFQRDALTVCPSCNIFLYSNEEITD